MNYKFLILAILFSNKVLASPKLFVEKKSESSANYSAGALEITKSGTLKLSLSSSEECEKEIKYEWEKIKFSGKFCLVKKDNSVDFYYAKDVSVPIENKVKLLEKKDEFWKDYSIPSSLNLNFLAVEQIADDQLEANKLCDADKTFKKIYKIYFSTQSFPEEINENWFTVQKVLFCE